MYLNTYNYYRACGDNGISCLCKNKIPACAWQDGSRPSGESQACMCGYIACTRETGLTCHAKDGICKRSFDCAFKAGLRRNLNTCGCGNIDCTPATGLFCYADHSECSADGKFDYFAITQTGYCQDTIARSSIDDEEMCIKASKRLDLFSDKVSISLVAEADSSKPGGCIYESIKKRIVLNSPRTSQENSCRLDHNCLCKESWPICSIVDGSAANTESCICGQKVCHDNGEGTGTGLVCIASDGGVCFRPRACMYTDGQILNSGGCSCGSVDCNTRLTTGLYCTVQKSGSMCTTKPVCLFGHGEMPNDQGSCACGMTICKSPRTTGMFCLAGASQCSRSNEFAFYEKRQFGKCDESEDIRFESVCERANKFLHLSSSRVTTVFDAESPYGCIFKNKKVHLNSYNTGHTCGHKGNACLCATKLPVCTIRDGSAPNIWPCACNGALCSLYARGIGTGMVCTAATSRCSRPKVCVENDGLIPNSEGCSCGNVDCSISTGLYCKASLHRCSKIPACRIADGSATNAQSSSQACGAIKCTVATGMFCSATASFCSF